MRRAARIGSAISGKLRLSVLFAGALFVALGWFSASGYAQTVTILSPTAAAPVWVGATGTNLHPCDAPNINVTFSWSGMNSDNHNVSINIGGRILSVTHVSGASGSDTRLFTADLCSRSEGLKKLTVTLTNPTTSGSQMSAVGIDLTLPTFSCAAASTVWSAGDVSRACTASDSGSGLATPASFSLTTNVPNDTETNNALTNTATVTDNAGNIVIAGPLDGNKVDKKAPALQSCQGADGLWHPDNVALTCSYADGGSGPASQILSLSTSVAVGIEDANASASTSSQACDAVGNCAPTPGPIVGNKIDRKPPTISGSRSPDPNANGWNNADVTVHFDCRDDGSGVASLTPDTVVSSDGTGQAVSGICIDGVGNSAGMTLGNINIGKTEPSITSNRSPDPNFYGWNNTEITVSFNCSDSGSGVASVTGPRVVRTEGLGQSRTGTCIDLADNSTSVTVSGINIDKAPPQVRAVPNLTPDEDGIYHDDVTVAFQGTDSLSGIVSCSPPQTVTSEGAGQIVEGRCVDYADNTASAGITLNIFKTIEPFVLRIDLGQGAIPTIGEDLAVDLVLKRVPQGLSAYHLIFRVGEPGEPSPIARIKGIESRTIDPDHFTIVRQESYEIEFSGQDVKDAIRPGDQSLPLARITLHILSLGQSTLSLSHPALSDPQVTEVIDDQGQVVPRSRIVLVPLHLEVKR